MRNFWKVQGCSVALLGALSLVSCKGEKIQFMPDMADTTIAKAQRAFLDPPAGSVAATAVIYPSTVEESEEQLKSPFEGQPPAEAQLAQGKDLYETFCAVCHGLQGKGDGTIADKMPAPDLTQDIIKNRKDGFFFHRITFGNVMMPSYGHAIDVQERWLIIAYLRTLQQK
jgi:mono/diheme cytochrome c family protein